jgi:peptidoglycan hydrolase-like protein with peptidoglycan-binding domain
MRPVESFVGQPIRSLQTMLRVIAENDPRHDTIVPDGIYGPETISAVSTFQRLHGLRVTGITDQPTWEAIVAQYKPALINIDEAQPIEVILNPNQIIRRGERHPVIYLTQGILAVLSEVHQSIASPGMNGILDGSTVDSLASFQQLHNLPMTGELDKQTWRLLALQFPLAQNLYFSR